MRKFTGNMPDAPAAAPVLCEPAQSKCTWTFHKSHFAWEFTGEMPYASTATSVLCEPAQSKYTWTFHKSHSMRKFTGNWLDTDDTTSNEHRAIAPTVRTPSVWLHCLGKKVWGSHRVLAFVILPLLALLSFSIQNRL